MRARARSQQRLVDLLLRAADAARPLLSAFGVDYPRFRALLELRMVLDTRPRTGAAAPGGLASAGLVAITGICLLVGSSLALPLSWAPPPVFVGVVTALLMFYGAVILLSLFVDLLFDGAAEAFIGARPVDDRTALAARLALVSIHVGLVVGALALGPLVVGILSYGGWPFGPLFLFAAASSAALATGGVVLVFMLALRALSAERFRAWVVRMQVGFTLAVFCCSQLAPLLLRKAQGIRLGIFAELLPPVWYADLMAIAAGSRAAAEWAGATLALIGPAAVLALALALARGRFVAAQVAPGAAAARSRPRRRGIAALLAASASAGSDERAGADVTLALFSRERGTLLRTAPMVVMYPLMALPMAGLGRVADWRGDVAWWAVCFGLAFAVPQVLLNARYSDQPAARWVLDVAPLRRRAPFAAAALRALLARFLILPGLAIVGFCAAVQGLRGLELGAVALSLGVLLAAAASRVLWDRVPFGETFQRGASLDLIGFSIGFTLATACAVGAEILLQRVPGALAVGALALPLCAWWAWRGLAALRLPGEPAP